MQINLTSEPTPPSTVPSDVDIKDRVRRGGGVQLVGQPATMSRQAFEELVAAYGGKYGHATVGTHPAIVVVGQRDWPLCPDGCLPDRLRELIARGRNERVWTAVLPEERFLAALGMPEYADGVHRLYTTSTLTELLGVAAETVRGWVTAGIIRPAATIDGVWHFDFRQVTAARTLTRLARRGISIRRMRRSLLGLRKWLPDADVPLEQLAILEQDGRLMVRLAEGELAEPDGQLQIEFETDSAPIKLPLVQTGPARSPRTPQDWYRQGIEQESNGYPAEAIQSYRQALRLGGPDAHVCFNLANALRDVGLRREAVERYAQAVELEPTFIDGWNNLGTVLSELGRSDEALGAFREALSRDPDNVVAIYNLADELETSGFSHEARPHWEAYLRHDAASERAAYARKRLKYG